MADQTKNKIRELIGMKLTQTSRSSNMECLKFGFKTNHINQNIGEFGLHIQTDWRIINEENILVGSNDLFEPNSENKSISDFDYETGNLRDQKLHHIINSDNLVVSKVRIDKIGGLNIKFKNLMELQIIPTNSSESEYNEFWRLIDNRKLKTQHIVSRISGIENE
ncbi:hypothetical protein [uncultured Tenacibaculum sp.]|uniref:hypothetical protein n=1 Tax=uncultured Tenacibaculum sp. TaxID=174713 RepID=UPI002629764D|nr:hypothetical protein [uncultured Tenacibaculum sp.]